MLVNNDNRCIRYARIFIFDVVMAVMQSETEVVVWWWSNGLG
jgi:hypothetical protein